MLAVNKASTSLNLCRIHATATTGEERVNGYQGSHSADWSGYADDLELFLISAEDL